MTPDRWRRINQLFHATLEQDPAGVEAFLARECAGDPELYSEVQRMREANSRSGLLDRAPWPPGQLLSAPVFAEGQTLSAGRYRIVQFVSRGGMGEVYEAEDLELHARVALKTLLPEIAGDPRMIARFKQEIQLSRKIPHPNVCKVYDLARHPADAPPEASIYFLTMEFLEGETLSARLQREGTLRPLAALPLLEQIAAALDAAHAAGVIHRDLKPSNVMLTPAAGGGERAVVTDFGLARGVAPGEATGAQTANVMGTLDYMAPELFAGRAASVAADVFALGIVARKMLTGSIPLP